ncbi:DUF6415 family natural product biosynthesis protein [Streptomyces sp. BPTC-684]|uniref:DUF6415 family natural product biosynthesis protein n=1 Tax=Streptomyces sp. BPTC-684 TaxID=3043734 RepID=UPI0024B23690|nr:DUF6415 family natural product biosynthesis protein [Streptomyces sp. BPTC-684]WHM38248.1 DUF6415 family natural product biosynthesis protein [Streptomyces sp. BPTC-684]
MTRTSRAAGTTRWRGPASARHPRRTAWRREPGWASRPRTARPAPGAYWTRPPRHCEDFCSPHGLAELIRLGSQVLAGPRALPGLDGIEQACRALFDDDSPQGTATATTRARDFLTALLPVTQEAATQLALDPTTQARLTRAITEAHRQLEADSTPLNPARQQAHTKRLARCCLDQVRLLRELAASADELQHF